MFHKKIQKLILFLNFDKILEILQNITKICRNNAGVYTKYLKGEDPMKKKNLLLSILAIIILIALIPKTEIYAKSKLYQLKNNKTYKLCDLNHDGKKDKIKVVQTKTYTKDFQTEKCIYINGKKKIKTFGCKGSNVYIFRTGNKGVILFEAIAGDGGRSFYAVNYTNKKYKKTEISRMGDFHGKLKVSGNYLTLTTWGKNNAWTQSFGDCWLTIQDKPYLFASVMKYKISKGKLKSATGYGRIIGRKTYYAKQTFTTGKTWKTANLKNGIQILKNQKIELKGKYWDKSSYRTYYLIRANGQNGWFEDSSTIQFY